MAWRIIVCLLIIAFLVFNTITTFQNEHIYYGSEQFDNVLDAYTYKYKLQTDAELNGGFIKSAIVNNDNKVSWLVYSPDDNFPYGEKRIHWYHWLFLPFQGLGTILSLLFLVAGTISHYATNLLSTSSFPIPSLALGIRQYTMNQKVGDGTAKHLKYKPQILSKVFIPPTTSGIIAMRDWIVVNGKLFSVTTGSEWTSRIVMANKKPAKNNNTGIYAYQLGRRSDYSNDVSGIVALYGKCQIGQDKGIIRAERCDILLLITEKPGVLLSRRYGVPVLLTSDMDIIEKWIITAEGIHWLKHNSDLIAKLTNPRYPNKSQIESEIADILKDNNF
jgi:hypothetical protein